MKKLLMTRGLPGSSKTTWAKKLQDDNPGQYRRVNKDDLRSMLDNSRWSKENEQFVLKVRDFIVTEALKSGKHAIVDDTGFGKHEPRLREIAKECGAAFQVVDFTDVPLETCIQRDLKRPNSVGEKVIRSMWNQFLRPTVEPPPYDPALPNCIIVDVDGTVAEMDGRGPFEWDKVHTDKPREYVIDAINALRTIFRSTEMIFVSGRDEGCREQTENWLQFHAVPSYCPVVLFMRPAGDMRRDSIVKRELYEKHIKGHYNVEGIFEDRRQVAAECWDILGFGDRLFRVGRVDADDF
jgi:predicted kinase